MVKITEYKPSEYMVNVTKEESLRIIKSLITQLANDDCNRDRIEFSKHHEDDVEYFSIAVDESVKKFDVMINMGAGNPVHDVTLNRFDTIEEAQKFMGKSKTKGIMKDYTYWIKEVMI